ncbi:MAG: MBL fold metallo-hydrolase [Rhodospirillales bacterium]|nr:MBL fold metallo-hydrolase [Rhodospirillales bacterium]
MTITVKFCGAAQTVTGSCYWIRTPAAEFLVDCGMFQGSKTLKELNYGSFPFDPANIDFVLLTHAHIDHSGLIPKLIKQGFTGPVYATEGTCDLLSYMLPDSGYIHEREVEHLNRRNVQRGKKEVEPIYDRHDAEKSLESFKPVAYEEWLDARPGIRARYWNAGHILGAASIELEIRHGAAGEAPIRILFSGDIGPDCKLFHPDPEAPVGWDYVVCEGTYGDRVRIDVGIDERRKMLANEINEVIERKGVLLIPAFAVERTQELLADISVLMRTGLIARVPLFLDSPLAIKATRVFRSHVQDMEDAGTAGELLNDPNVHFTETVDESKAIDRYNGGIIIMAASGMCDAGRIRHHLKQYLPSKDAKVLLVGYQAPATLGNILAAGVKAVRIQGEDIKVRAEIRQLDFYSGHADRHGLTAWVTERLPIRRKVLLTHGEEKALLGLQESLVQAGLDKDMIVMPEFDEEFDLVRGLTSKTDKRKLRRIRQDAVGGPDWHNDLAQLSLDLRARLEAAADEKSRAVILRKVRRALQ